MLKIRVMIVEGFGGEEWAGVERERTTRWNLHPL